MSYICFRFFVYKNYNMEIAVVSHICFHFLTYKNRNIGEVAIDVSIAALLITDMTVSNTLFLLFRS